MNSLSPEANSRSRRHSSLQFVLAIGAVSLFADLTYEGSRSITGQLLQTLGASGLLVSAVAGVGECLGYGLRVFSGKISEHTQAFWPITFVGYVIQMSSVPLLALARNWETAALLIVLERIGKAIRNPPRDVMLSHAARQIGYGWGFGVHEALDQSGAFLGPLAVALILARHGHLRMAFVFLLIPALLTLLLLTRARLVYPRSEDLAPQRLSFQPQELPKTFWIYLGALAIVAASFADFQLMAFHFQKHSVLAAEWIPISYSIAMAVSGMGSLAAGRLFDRFGIIVLLPLTAVTALAAPLVFLGGFSAALVGVALWGLGSGVHESIIPAAVATMVPAERLPYAYGLMTGAFGIFWLIGSLLIGALYQHSLWAVVIFCSLCELASLPLFFAVLRRASIHR